jgi:hexosaminidase
LALAGWLAVVAGAGLAVAQPPPLIPLPAEITARPGGVRIADGATVVTPPGDAEALFAAQRLVDLVKRTRGLTLVIGQGRPGAGRIVLERGGDVEGPEGYGLEVSAQGVRVRAQTEAGLFYGAMTLAQLLSPGAHFGGPVDLPAMSVRDQPRFVWRGLLLDVARHFQPIPSIEVLIDQMAAHKLNVLHLHLTDDQGWRLEITRYPMLTQVGGWRTPVGDDGPRVGGVYTQDQIHALVAFAAARHVTIVPEIDMPGHAQAAVAAYPEIGVLGDRPPVSTSWGVKPYLFNVSPQGLAFVQGVLDEVMALFPSTYIHVGGDEAIKDQWRLSPAVQAKMRDLGIRDEDALQSWFIAQVGGYLAAHGRRLIGWDEILEGGLPPSASVMSWRGEQGAIDAANAGHDVVLSPAPTLYFDNLQTGRADEPPGRLAIVPLQTVYAYDPLPAAIAADKARHVLGAEGAIWTDGVVTPEEVQHAVFPRLDALAEISWSPKAKRDWPGFLARLDPQSRRYERLGVAAADGAFAVTYAVEGGPAAALRTGRARIALATQAGYGRIRYTLDGAAPNARSPLYTGPIEVSVGAVISAAAFTEDGHPTAAPRRFDAHAEALLTRSSSDLSPCPNDRFGLRMPLTTDAQTEAPAFNVDRLDACFVYRNAPLDLISGFTIQAARLPRHYGAAYDEEKVVVRRRATAFGELVVHTSSCEGPAAAVFPLPDPANSPNRLTFKGVTSSSLGGADLCLVFTAPANGPIYAIDKVSLTPR